MLLAPIDVDGCAPIIGVRIDWQDLHQVILISVMTDGIYSIFNCEND